MSSLRYVDQLKLEKLFGMSSGYVLGFSNSTFREFIADSVKVDIYDGEYDYGSCSKANMLRGFIKRVSNFMVGKLLLDLLEYWKACAEDPTDNENHLYLECEKIAKRLLQDSSVENLDAITPNSNDVDFTKISEIIKLHIEKDEPEVALDRLHTFLMKYSKNLCEIHGIPYTKDDALNSIFGKYVRCLRDMNVVESKITFKILGSVVQILELFNKVRNDKSFAHDNPLLNYNESLLIFNNVCNFIAFINFIEETYFNKKIETKNDEIPF